MKNIYYPLPLFTLLAACSSGVNTNMADNNFPLDSMESFVIQSGDQLLLNNKPFRFAGTNNYYMHYRSHEM